MVRESLRSRAGVAFKGATTVDPSTCPSFAGGRPRRRPTSCAGSSCRSSRTTPSRACSPGAAIALGIVALIGMGFGWLMAERALRPLARITETARRVAGRSLHERIALTGPKDEIKELADTFDSMLERLDRAFDGQRMFVGNASHELRTPLAINRTLIEVALGRTDVPPEFRLLGDTLLAVNARQERLLDGLLTVARSEQGLVDVVPVDLADVAGHVLDQTPLNGLDLRRDLGPAATSGDPVLLERVVQNLVQNAVAYNVEGRLGVGPDGDQRRPRRGGGHEHRPGGAGVRGPGAVRAVPAAAQPGRVGGRHRARAVDRPVGGDHATAATVTATPRAGGGLVVRVTLPGDKN